MNNNVLVVTEHGYGKQTPLKEYKVQGRGGAGIFTAKITVKNGGIVNALIIRGNAEELITISERGQVIRTTMKDIPIHGRATQGVRIMKLDTKDRIASITTI